MTIQLSVHDWLELPADTRSKLTEIFKIPRSQGASIEHRLGETYVKSDGHTHDDLSVISIAKMQEYLDSNDDDFISLFNKVLDKLAEQIAPDPIVLPDPVTLLLDEWVATFNRVKGQAAEKGLEPALTSLVKRVFNIKTTQNETPGLPQEDKKTIQRKKRRNKTPASVS